jgi:3-oxoadipate enol-lactonase
MTLTSAYLDDLQVQTGSFNRAGTGLYYWSAGNRNSPTVVLTHGITIDHGTYAPQVPALLEAGYRVVTWDLRGHGLSRPSPEAISIRAAAEDMAMLLDQSGTDRSVWVGQSFGGMVVQELYRQQPHRAAGLVLIGSPSLGQKLPWHQALLQGTRPFILRLWPEGHLRSTIPAHMSDCLETRQYIHHATGFLSKDDLVKVTAAALDGFLKYKPIEKVDAPVLVLRGEHEMPMVVGWIQEWVERDPQIRLQVVPAAGHLANQENPQAFNELLMGFLSEVLPV